MDPSGLIQTIISTGYQVYLQVDQAKVNKEQFARMGQHVKDIVDALQNLNVNQLPRHKNFQSGLERMRDAMQACLVFIQAFTGKSWAMRVLKAGNHKDEFKQLNRELKASLNVLNLGINVQHFQNTEADKVALAKDNQALRDQMQELIVLVQQQQAQQLKVNPRRKTLIMKQQAESVQDRIERQIAGESILPSKTVPKNLQIPLFELAFDEEIASGSFGTVYRGRHAGRPVAIKEVSQLSDASAMKEFEREIKIMGELHSGQVVQLFGACLESGRACIVMEYCQQGSLYDYLDKAALTAEQKHQLLQDIAMGLTYLHHRGVLHRDLKSANVLLDAEGHAKISDFGLSKTNRATVMSADNRSTALAWMAPEIITDSGLTYTAAADVYSFGVIMWEILTGQRPQDLQGSELANYLMRAERESIPTHLDPFYQQLLRSCWSKTPTDRPSMDDVLRDLQTHVVAPPSPRADTLYDEAFALDCQAKQHRGTPDEDRYYREAYPLYLRAANKGHAGAQSNLARFFQTGRGGAPVNKQQACEFYQKAADQKHLLAMHNLGSMYAKGDGVERDIHKAYGLFTAVQAHPEATTLDKQEAANMQSRIERHAEKRGISLISV